MARSASLHRYWNELDRGHYAFDLRENLAAAIRDVSLADLQASYENLLRGRDSKRLIVRAAGVRSSQTRHISHTPPQASSLRTSVSFEAEARS